MSSELQLPASRWAAFQQRLGKPPLRQLLQLLAVLGISYVAIIVLLMFQENRLLYHPFRDHESWIAPPANLQAEEVWMTLPDGSRIHGWWCPRQGATGAILFAHGNSGNLSWHGAMAEELQTQLGRSVLLFDYPGYGKCDGQPNEAGCYAAALAAYDWLANKVPAEQIVLYGESMGGGIATELALRRAHQALVLSKTFSSMPDMAQETYPWIPARWLVRNRFDNLAKIGQCPRPVFIAHGDCDTLIPLHHGQRLYDAAPQPKRFYVLTECNHEDGYPADFYTSLNAFLRDAK